ncbi:pentapeptide repeat-containing protein [Methylomonas sp. HYX-M1]|uniref:pentapeptide repeat-containing protein n=1 Tax=Methylomonas sp. HYX-M1 TaxID=3139307 RepID=UPI00345BB001
MKLPLKRSTLLISLCLAPLVADAAGATRINMVFLGVWDQQQKYRKGDVVSYNDTLYQSLKSKNQDLQPDQVSSHWRKILGSGTSAGSGNAADCDNPASGANLVGCDFSGAAAKLRSLDLRAARLVNATLAGDLGDVNLTGANLVGAKLGSGNDSEDATGVSLSVNGGDVGASFRGANLSQSSTAFTTPLQAASVHFDGADMTGVLWPSANLEVAFFPAATLVYANLINASLYLADLSHADMRGVVLDSANLNLASLYQANLVHAALGSANLEGANFYQADVRYAYLGSTKLAGADFSGADLSYADLTNASGGDSVLYDANTRFNNTICPDGSKVNGNTIVTCQGHGFGAPQ